MTILQELAAVYSSRAEKAGWPRPGYSTEKIGGVIVLNEDGSVKEIQSRMSPNSKGNLQPTLMSVPAAVSRPGRGTKSNLLWDKTEYSLGITNVKRKSEEGKAVKTPEQTESAKTKHEAFCVKHLEFLAHSKDMALHALFLFCQRRDRFSLCETFPDAVPLIDQNLVFRLRDGPYLHDLPEAKDLIREEVALIENGRGTDAICLVTGRSGPIARLHPPIKGIQGAQTSGAALVSFNNPAETSHGKSQGENAPVSQETAFAYGTTLNAFLVKGSGNSLRIGGDTMVFWADQPEAEWTFEAMMSGTDDEAAERTLRDRVIAFSEGRHADDTDLHPDARLFVLGLAPNAARLSVRYWHPGTLGGFACSVARFWKDMLIEPSPFVREGVKIPPKPWALLYDIAAQSDAKNIPAGLGGDLMRAILTGARYPATLLSSLLGRLRVEGDPDRSKYGNIDGRRAAMIAAFLRRNKKEEVPVALDQTNTKPAYLLGRLFNAYTYAEKSNQERNASLRQKYFASASATPARVFPVLMRGYENNFASLRKTGGQKAGTAKRVDGTIEEIINLLQGTFPATLPLEEQGLFFIGFYHQNSAFYEKYEKSEDAADAGIENEEGDDA